ncbi:MAG: hypothetical protein Q7S76_00690 [bacterium]|nr:hypothetical protein [bacterium]
MNDLPDPTPQVGNRPIHTNNPIIQLKPPISTAGASSGGGGKELETITGSGLEAVGVREIGREANLPAEVAGAGVSIHPISVTLPPNLAKMGVQPAGEAVTLGKGTTIHLPLTDEEIALGMRQNITSSWRWLAAWCVRRLLQVHVGLKNVHGKLVRINE